MQKNLDLTGKSFNHLTAIKYICKDKNKKSLWLFKCECGTEKIFRASNVIYGSIKSCGCKNRGMNLKHNEKQIYYTKYLHGKNLRSKTDLYKNNKSGVTGVHQRSDGRFHCSICVNGVKHATTKSTFKEAVAWRKTMEEKYND